LKTTFLAACLLLLTFSFQPYSAHATDDANAARVFDFWYEVEDVQSSSDQDVDIYVPLPAETAHQQVLAQTLDASHEVTFGKESRYGNSYLRVRRAKGDDTPIKISARWRVKRTHATPQIDDARIVDNPEQFLGSNAKVLVGHPILEPILDEIYASRPDESSASTARAIYDWVVDNVEYKKVGTGWGNGDTFWACNERYGNCTDFHALFTSLARTEEIPARFEIGFPIPQSRPAGNVAGYHCWVQFYLPQQGWVPIDASEAFKFPEKRELFFGAHPADRIQFTTGRDLVVSEATEKRPLNYFVYPHVEVGGQTADVALQTSFRYQDVESLASR